MKKSITLAGMSGVGKTTLSRKLPTHKWFHYSTDYRIATHYLRDAIGDFLKVEAMQSPLLAALLKSDSICIDANVSIDNLAPLSAYVGRLGQAAQGGLDLETFLNRQQKHSQAENAACYDIGYFKSRASNVYGYDYFLHDASGSICELDDAVIAYVAKETDFVYIHADETLNDAITQRAIDYPKPLYYNSDFLAKQVNQYLEEMGLSSADEIVPDAFIRYVIPELFAHRRARYVSIAERYGRIVDANVMYQVRDEKDFLDILERD